MRFPIRFLPTPRSQWRWSGRGELEVEAGALRLSGRRQRSFLLTRPQQLTLALGDVFNVAARARLLTLSVRVAGAAPQSLRLRAADAAAAAQIAALLPAERTPEFERSSREQQGFDAALAALESRALVTPVLVGANVLTFLAVAAAGGGWLDPVPAVLIRFGSNFGAYTLDGEWWRLFTCMFLHFGLLHLALNMWALWSLGRLTERLFGSAPYLLLYLFAGLCGSLASIWWRPLINSAGASGAIFGVLGALLAFMVNPRTHIPPSVAAPQRNSALVFVAYNLMNGFTHAGIDNAAHLGGLAGGFALGWLLARPLSAGEREQPVAHLASGALVAGVALLGLSWSVLHPNAAQRAERHFTRTLMHFGMEQDALLEELSRLGTSAQYRSISPSEFARRVDADLVPRWQAFENDFNAAELPSGSRLAPLRTELLDYTYGYRMGLELLAAGAARNDPQKERAGQQLLRQAQERAQGIRRLMSEVY